MKLVVIVGLSALALVGCQSRSEREAIAAGEAGTAACKAQTFRTAVARVRCLNAAAAPAVEKAGGRDADLFRVAMAKRMVLAERVDRGQITQAEFDLEMAQTMAGLQNVGQQRDTNAAIADANARAAYNQHMQNTQRIMNSVQGPRTVNCTSTPGLGQINTTCQ